MELIIGFRNNRSCLRELGDRRLLKEDPVR